jgi:hypothetical protein
MPNYSYIIDYHVSLRPCACPRISLYLKLEEQVRVPGLGTRQLMAITRNPSPPFHLLRREDRPRSRSSSENETARWEDLPVSSSAPLISEADCACSRLYSYEVRCGSLLMCPVWNHTDDQIIINSISIRPYRTPYCIILGVPVIISVLDPCHCYSPAPAPSCKIPSVLLRVAYLTSTR